MAACFGSNVEGSCRRGSIGGPSLPTDVLSALLVSVRARRITPLATASMLGRHPVREMRELGHAYAEHSNPRCAVVAELQSKLVESWPRLGYPDPRVSTLPTQSVARRIAETLVRTGAVAFRTEPFFRLTSGTESPVYVDNRQLLGHVVERLEVVDAFLMAITAQPAPEVIAGTATAGIPWGAWLADRLSLPFLYVRSQAKAWGKESAVEGTAPEGARVLVIEDLAFSAGSLAAAAENLRAAGFLVEDALTIASYEMPSAHERLEALGLRHMTLTTIDEALAAAARAGSLEEGQVSVVAAWLRDRRAKGN